MRPRDNPLLPGFVPSKKCEHHFGAKGHTLEECANFETLNPRSHQQQVSTIRQHG